MGGRVRVSIVIALVPAVASAYLLELVLAEFEKEKDVVAAQLLHDDLDEHLILKLTHAQVVNNYQQVEGLKRTDLRWVKHLMVLFAEVVKYEE